MAKNYDRIWSLDQLEVIVAKLMEAGRPVAFDVETGYEGLGRERGALDVDWPGQFVCGFSFTNDVRWARYVPVAHDMADNLPEREAWEVMRPLLEGLPIVCHHWKFEARNVAALERKGRGPAIDLRFGADTMLEGYVLQEVDLPTGGRAEFRTFGLKAMVAAAFGHDQTQIAALFPDLKGPAIRALRFNQLELTPEVIAYACEDSAWTLALHELLEPVAKTQRPFMLTLENRIAQLLVEMQDFGLHVEWEEMAAERARTRAFLAQMERAVKTGLGELAGRDLTTLNLGSIKQLQELLYRDLGFVTTRRTGTADSEKNAGKEAWEVMSTDAVAMEGLSKSHPALRKLLEWREVQNHVARFDKWLDENHFSYDGRIHPNFAQTKVPTGRFAANEPPVQQMPKEWRFTTEVGLDCWADHEGWRRFVEDPGHLLHRHYWTGNFRDYVSADVDCYLLGFDYSQIELRVMAGVSQEQLLLDAFRDGLDVHTITAAMMLGKSVAEVDQEVDRQIGKTMNFALLYQMGPKSLAERLALTMERARELYDMYFAQFASIRTWMEKTRNQGIVRKYVETPFGRKVRVWDLDSDYQGVKAKGERVLINAPIQGGAADYMKMAMLRAREALVAEGLWGERVRMVHNLHDALTFEVSNAVNPNELRALLESAVIFDVKNFPTIVADWELGQRHGSCAKWKPGYEAAWDAGGGTWELVGDGAVPAEVELVPELVTAMSLAEEPLPEWEPESVEEESEYVEALREDGVEVLVSTREMPTERQIERLLDLIISRPGGNVLTLELPEGSVTCAATTSLDLPDQGTLSMILGGAEVRYSSESVDMSALAADIVI